MEPDYLKENHDQQSKPTFGTHIVDFIQTVVVFAAITTIIYLFIAQPHKVSGYSMFPNYHDGDYIITDKLTYRLGQPKRGDIVVFKNPRDDSQDFIKRIIGLPSETIKLENGSIFINGQKLNEPYLSTDMVTEGEAFLQEGEEIKIGEDQYFVLGDNRIRSQDSREWGPINKQVIIGKVFLRYWPKGAVGFYPAYYNQK